MYNEVKSNMKPVNLKMMRKGYIFKIWFVSFIVPVLLITSALTFFREALIATVENTTFPVLVYGIFAAFLFGLILCAVALIKYQREIYVLRDWFGQATVKDKQNWLHNQCKEHDSAIFSVLKIITLKMPASEKQAKFEHEVRALESSLTENLLFPNFIAGSLVGLGLVGTFVGLLGTLNELGLVFGALSGTADSTVNPTAAFSDMVQKLQDPMRGMGTAFVTSLYGLLGSLVLGFASLSIARLVNELINGLYMAEREYAVYAHSKHNLLSNSDTLRGDSALSIHEQLTEITTTQDMLKHSIDGINDEFDRRFEQILMKTNECQEAFLERVSNRILNDGKTLENSLNIFLDSNRHLSNVLLGEQEQINSTVQLIANQIANDKDFLYGELLAFIGRNKDETNSSISDIHQVLNQITSINETTARNIDRFIKGQEENTSMMPNTPYWREAWSKVQSYLKRSKADDDLNYLAETVARQTVVLNRLVDQLSHGQWSERNNIIHHQESND